MFLGLHFLILLFLSRLNLKFFLLIFDYIFILNILFLLNISLLSVNVKVVLIVQNSKILCLFTKIVLLTVGWCVEKIKHFLHMSLI